ncbi:pentapeptide repeat-containing protein [Nocardioides zeae]|uniref:Pentapeptide repeat-containing protein n=1 Tax=Nocardioides zeae TaxID=1457234 RepID=A0A6P0HI36_9ACTN|nr:pentapeptide repeat-containing protein [Nocardioides zeae]NEN78206.1 pentapeptide repeat-containing protein [Nocardioides zeae]
MARRRSTSAPRIAAPALGPLVDGDPTALRPGGEVDGLRFGGLRLGALELAGARLIESQLEDVHADEADLSGARLSDVALDGVSLPVVRAIGTQWRDVRVTGRIGSLEAYESSWRSVHLVGCKLSFVNLRGAELLDVLLEGCVVEELDLGGAALSRVRLADTTVGRLDVQQAQLADVDLRGARLDDVTGVRDLRGATVSPAQLALLAPAIAAELGLRVED